MAAQDDPEVAHVFWKELAEGLRMTLMLIYGCCQAELAPAMVEAELVIENLEGGRMVFPGKPTLPRKPVLSSLKVSG